MVNPIEPHAASGDAELEQLLVQCIEEGEVGGQAAVSKILAAHRDRAEELRQLLGSLASLGLLSDDSDKAPVADGIGNYELLRCPRPSKSGPRIAIRRPKR